MEVSQKLWQDTRAAQAINIFPGQLAEFLLSKNLKAIERAEEFLPYIFWRWYFLESEVRKRTTPYFDLEHLKKLESWPKKGQFFVQPAIKRTEENKYEASLTLDYICFEEQPFLVDLKNTLDGKQLTFGYNQKCHSDLDFLKKHCQEHGFKSSNLNTEKICQLIKVYFEENLKDWYKKDSLFQKAFTFQSWLNFWRGIMRDIKQTKDYSTETLSDEFVSRIRQFFPDYGFSSDQLQDNPANSIKALTLNEAKRKDFSFFSYFYFWLNFAYYVLVPYSFYLHLLAPVFIDKELFKQDVNEILDRNYEDPMPIYAPCSYLYPTFFGKEILNNLG